METKGDGSLDEGYRFREPLTAREREILQSVADGLSNAEIAEQYFLSITTVKWHLKNTYAKLGVHKRTAAVRLGHARGILRVESIPIVWIHPSPAYGSLLGEEKYLMNAAIFASRHEEMER